MSIISTYTVCNIGCIKRLGKSLFQNGDNLAQSSLLCVELSSFVHRSYSCAWLHPACESVGYFKLNLQRLFGLDLYCVVYCDFFRLLLLGSILPAIVYSKQL